MRAAKFVGVVSAMSISVLLTGVTYAAGLPQETPSLKNIPPSVMDTKTYRSVYANLLKRGLSRTNARYYAIIQSRLHSMIKEGKKVSLAGIQPLSASIMQSDPEFVKNRILQMNPSAILSVLQSKIYSTGMQRLTQLEQSHPGQSEYVVQYPDGSTLTATIHRGTSQKTYLGHVSKKSPEVQPQGYQQSTFGSGIAYSSGTGYSVTVKLSSPIAYSQNSVFSIAYTADPYDANGNPVPTQPHITYYQTGQDSFGIISIANQSASVSNPGYLEQQVENAVIFSVSGAIGLSGAGLSLSLNGGSDWTQYAIFKVSGATDAYYDIAATYD